MPVNLTHMPNTPGMPCPRPLATRIRRTVQKFVILFMIRTKQKHERDAHFTTKARGPSISFRLDCKAAKAIASLEKVCLVTVNTLSSAFSTNWK